MSATGSSRGARSRAAAALAAVLCFALAVALAACGERRFSAEEFIGAAGDQGLEITLGEPLSTGQGDADLYAVTIAAGAGKRGASAVPAAGSGGSLRVEDDVEAASAQYARCEQAGLFCYRAANVVLVFEDDAEPDDLSRLAEALRAIEDD